MPPQILHCAQANARTQPCIGNCRGLWHCNEIALRHTHLLIVGVRSRFARSLGFETFRPAHMRYGPPIYGNLSTRMQRKKLTWRIKLKNTRRAIACLCIWSTGHMRRHFGALMMQCREQRTAQGAVARECVTWRIWLAADTVDSSVGSAGERGRKHRLEGLSRIMRSG